METKQALYLKLLKIIFGIYILLAILIAGLNYGYARAAPQNIASLITWIWLVYENWIKAAFILIGSFLTIKIIGSSKRTTMRKANLVGFIISALAVHIVMPLLVNNYDLYFFAMPFPWATTPLQLLEPNSSLYLNTVNSLGTSGIQSALAFFTAVSLVVFIGTLLYGRRFQCSSICLFNGFAAEVFEPAIPLIGKRKKIKHLELRFMNVIKWLFLGIALLFITYWVLHLVGITTTPDISTISKLESYKYLVGELLLTLFFWVVFIGRGYCYYCPLGTVLSGVSRIAGQKITTNNTKCIECNKCNEICPMSIDIKSKAINGESVQNIRCVGCGHCIDECPTKTLAYATHFVEFCRNKRKPSKNS
ncbi:MAG: 4Fe-4S dicluster domain-containing protein [Candidatus Bathyarchaeota archaeon]|nr:4Fe-4S dicluster domain-containing protein [Candidatus Bathyarchaeota archaeon]